MTRRGIPPTGWRPGHTYCLIVCLTLIAIAIIGRIH